ncbi:2-dehydro-3-deoxygalactonokinase [Ponticoccus sp. (in: a-proteobacteria)]|uniref:2-dehydro-3-deoxygalactonokinase n=1 Tax=Ponticoccus sp. (in: a-proteobacteria) TaxID=1925025 RepID=UPI003AB35374
MTTETPVAWIAADWGTSHLRVWLMDAEDRVIRRLTSDRGMGGLAPDAFESALLDLVGDTLGEGVTDVLICGMAGARQGWAEVPYAKVPCPAPTAAMKILTADPRLSVRILPGLSQAQPPDVMRGEETQIGGFLALERGFDGVLCLPGTHCKWAHVSASEIVSFRTFMTGEVFALLTKHSVLRHSTGGDDWDAAAFDAAVSDALSKPGRLLSDLFTLRANGLLNGTGAGVSRARLSGLLIGAELAAARPYWLGQPVVILGEDALARNYLAALTAQGAEARSVAAEDITLAGLKAARTGKDKT